MKKTPETKTNKIHEMAAEYRNEPLIVMVDPDIAKVFTTSKEVNKALRALISAMPEKRRRLLS